MNIERKIEIIDGVAYIITKQEVTKKQLEQIKAAQVKQKIKIEQSVADIDMKIPQIIEKPAEGDIKE